MKAFIVFIISSLILIQPAIAQIKAGRNQTFDDQLVKYQITGNGILAGVGNGNPRDVSSFQKREKKVFQGRGLVVIRASEKAGNIQIVAKGEGLKDGVLVVRSK